MFILPSPTLLTRHPKGDVGNCLYSDKYTPAPGDREAERGGSVAGPKLFYPNEVRQQISKDVWGTTNTFPKLPCIKNKMAVASLLISESHEKCLLSPRLTRNVKGREFKEIEFSLVKLTYYKEGTVEKQG